MPFSGLKLALLPPPGAVPKADDNVERTEDEEKGG